MLYLTELKITITKMLPKAKSIMCEGDFNAPSH